MANSEQNNNSYHASRKFTSTVTSVSRSDIMIANHLLIVKKIKLVINHQFSLGRTGLLAPWCWI
ncbi:hypothetical protein EPYR_01336 [Erwinia pyrifoliae DSM 12163]|nr:hypothetical protein CPI84_12420 [Erwinia pyrifoliae]MCA8876498.1 hypothetical protein [Erwinia pyrifoliae]CAX55033.1 uncharacterized protein EpC_12540 [Erwinia pyrifoliae Ep1/96]CAY73716.1 hypothetical protein EPYR_01336 [Erwinia pyrifoliae DSM 12163]